MKAHPLTEIFPMIEGAEFRALVDDIREHGLREPIVTCDGMILDGRHRWAACLEASVEPRTVEFQGGEPLAYVVSMNLTRRHLDESQRAMVHARLATLPRGANQHTAIAVPSQEDAAKLLNVSVDSGQRARKVLEHGSPELVKAVETGEASVHAASIIARNIPKGDQGEIVARGRDEILKAARVLLEQDRVQRIALRGEQHERLGQLQKERREKRAETGPPLMLVEIRDDGMLSVVREGELGENYEDLVYGLIEARHEAGLSQAAVDQRAGWQEGYTAKLELWQGPGGRIAGAITMPQWFEAVGFKFVRARVTV